MFSIHDEEQVKNLLKENKIAPFRYNQIENALYKNMLFDFDKWQTIPKDVRELFKINCFFSSLHLKKRSDSENKQTTKLLFETEDGYFIEAVIMRHLTGRNTLCVSCQAGCPMGCSFCATGKLGLKRNLTFYEILDQVMMAMKILQEEKTNLRNLVYMGMGEPFANYDAVKKSLEVVCAQKKINLWNRRVTISTCGIIPWIEAFSSDFPQTSLAISLHAPNDFIRDKLMPINKKYPLKDLMQALDLYVEKTNKRIFYEYIMLEGINDSLENAEELGKILEGRLAHVNFIPYNAWEAKGWNYRPSSRIIIEKFQRILEKYGVPSTIRVSLGDDIDAACWQLATKEGEKD